MSFVSIEFLVFTAICVAGYYLIPGKFQWVWLLVFSYIYYVAAGPSYLFFILFATTATYLGGLWAESGARWAVPTVLLADFGMLAFIKYTNFILGNINGIFGTQIREMKLLLPLGISFYTFQATGYLLDVHWKRCKAERNPFRFALFLAFFPQIMQGPIGRMSRLSDQLYAERKFDMARIERGLYRIAWGFFKKIVIADNAALYVDAIFDNYTTIPGYGIMGVLLYGAQLYADFSGGIDVVIGISEMLGITLDENFTQPFFATSITDFWHRWHITLGTWMKDYLFYPVSLTRWMASFGKWARKKFGKNIGRALPICVANIIVFLVVGVWHGPAWHNIFYGLYNGLIIGISGLLARNFRDWKKKLNISKTSRAFYYFQIIRTFILVNISWYLDRAGSTHQALVMMRDSITKFHFGVGMVDSSALWAGSALTPLIAALIGCLVVLVHSILRERKIDTRGWIMKKPVPVRCLVLFLLLMSLVIIGNKPLSQGGFIYANF